MGFYSGIDAGFGLNFPDDFLSELLDMDTEELALDMLKEAAPILEKSMKTQLTKVIKHDGDSELVESIKISKPYKFKTIEGYGVSIMPSGYSKVKVFTGMDSYGGKSTRKYPLTNAMKAIWKEYGVPGKQDATPFMDETCIAVENEVMSKMQEVYNGKVGNK